MGTYCGIDVGERKLFAAAIEVDDARVVEVQFAETASIDEVIGWVADRGAEAVGVDAPPGPNLGFLADPEKRQKLGITKPPKNTDRRVADYQLGIGGWYSTPSSEGAAQGWMRTGFQVYRELAGRTGLQIDRGDGGGDLRDPPDLRLPLITGRRAQWRPLEVRSPQAAQAEESERVRGHRQRVEMLIILLEHFGKTTDDCLKTRLEGSIDRTGCPLLGALLGFLRHRKQTISVGIDPEGAIHLVDPTRARGAGGPAQQGGGQHRGNADIPGGARSGREDRSQAGTPSHALRCVWFSAAARPECIRRAVPAANNRNRLEYAGLRRPVRSPFEYQTDRLCHNRQEPKRGVDGAFRL